MEITLHPPATRSASVSPAIAGLTVILPILRDLQVFTITHNKFELIWLVKLFKMDAADTSLEWGNCLQLRDYCEAAGCYGKLQDVSATQFRCCLRKHKTSMHRLASVTSHCECPTADDDPWLDRVQPPTTTLDTGYLLDQRTAMHQQDDLILALSQGGSPGSTDCR